ncbi:MAG: hypothetical protein GY705_10535 [Bacteroidetes bacterium]|nr:hypothetical protein [Bacteroidota bacterium]
MNSRLLILLLFTLAFRLDSSGLNVPDLPVFSIYSVQPDSLPVKKYQGYRLFVHSMKTIRKADDWVKIQYTVVNTGRHTVDAKILSDNIYVQINFDHSIDKEKLRPFKSQIRQSLLTQPTPMETGEVKKDQYLKFSTKPHPKVQAKGKLVKKTTIPTEEVEKDRVLFATQITKQTKEELLSKKEQCSDLIIEDVKILQESKKWLTLEYCIRNIGKGSAHLLGESEEERDNLAIKAYMSGSSRLTRGAIFLGGEFVQQTAGIQDGFLPPGEQFKGEIKLDIRKKSRYTPIIILSLDVFQALPECNRTNNTNHIILK